ncbi:MAG: preprotein translocase subunit SecB [Candidatus Azotimanducaceae bacterium]|jgi:preprotein translocase subunit SecB
MSDQPQTTNEGAEGAQFALQRIYVKDASFESPRAPACFVDQWKPKVNLDLNTRHSRLENDVFEVVLHVTITTRNEADEVMYLAEVQQAGIFLIKGLGDEALSQTLGSFCPSVLFPYVREAIDSLVLKASFPPLMLAPVNFDAIYEQSKRQRSEQQQANPAPIVN